MAYLVHSIWPTIQGEGYWTGTPAVFVRLSGCNIWSGRSEDRTGPLRGVCAAWCDTEFTGTTETGGRLTLDDLLARVWAHAQDGIVVLTGGEPALQTDETLVAGLKGAGYLVHIETNGSRLLPPGIDWVTVSPKPPMRVVLDWAQEVKCIWPDVDPKDWRELAPPGRVFVQPRDDGHPLGRDHWEEVVDYVLANPWCRLSLQTHKLIGVE